MSEKTQLSIEQKIGHYAGVLHSLCHSRAETPEHCKAACEALDTAINKTSSLLTHLIHGELPRPN